MLPRKNGTINRDFATEIRTRPGTFHSTLDSCQQGNDDGYNEAGQLLIVGMHPTSEKTNCEASFY